MITRELTDGGLFIVNPWLRHMSLSICAPAAYPYPPNTVVLGLWKQFSIFPCWAINFIGIQYNLLNSVSNLLTNCSCAWIGNRALKNSNLQVCNTKRKTKIDIWKCKTIKDLTWGILLQLASQLHSFRSSTFRPFQLNTAFPKFWIGLMSPYTLY